MCVNYTCSKTNPALQRRGVGCGREARAGAGGGQAGAVGGGSETAKNPGLLEGGG